jgi:hypothetical protein
MAGYPIRIGGREVTYFPADEALGAEDSKAVGFDFSEDAGFRSHPRLRRVLTTMVRPTPKFYGVLHWSDNSDLSLLDEKVRGGQADDADFAGALLAEPRTIVCRACQAQLRVLAVDTGQALFARTLAERLRGHALKASCPACGQPLGVPVVEFIEPG